MEKLLNVENDCDRILEADIVEGPCEVISKREVEEAIKNTKVEKAAGPSEIVVKILKAAGNKQQLFIFNEVVFPSVLGSTSPMAFPQHSPPPSPVPSILPTKSLLSHIFFQHFSPSLPGPAFHSITIYLQCLNSLYPTQLISPLNMTKPPQPLLSHHFSNVINCQMLLTHSLLFLPLKLTPVIHLNILISLLCIFLISSTFVGHVSLPYNIAGLMHVV